VWLSKRKEPVTTTQAKLVFVTKYGASWHNDDRTGSAITAEFRKLLNRLKLYRPGLSFYAIRHTFQTIADDAGDYLATRRVMGHADNSISDHYRERFDAPAKRECGLDGKCRILADLVSNLPPSQRFEFLVRKTGKLLSLNLLADNRQVHQHLVKPTHRGVTPRRSRTQPGSVPGLDKLENSGVQSDESFKRPLVWLLRCADRCSNLDRVWH